LRLFASLGALNGASCFLVKLFSERSELKKLGSSGGNSSSSRWASSASRLP